MAKGLTDTKIKNAKPQNKQYKIYDSRGLFMIIAQSGGKWWRFKYRFDGKEKQLSMGVYPDVSLAKARKKRDQAREQVADGIDPGEVRKALKASKADGENTLEVIAREWHTKFTPTWSPKHAKKLIRRLELNIFPWLGNRPILEIKAPEVLMQLRRVESCGSLETAHRVRVTCSQVFRYAVATGRAERDPTADLKGALPPAKRNHLAAITEPEKIGCLLRAIDGYEGSFITKCALKLASMLFVRPGELRHMEWSEIDLDTEGWNIPAEKMKMKHPHMVPLASQAVAVLKELQPLTGSSRYVFPSVRTSRRPMSNNTVNAALRRMGYEKTEMTGHGFRAMARTILDEVLQVRPDYIEHQLAHAVRDPLGRAYNRTTHLPERRKMMQTWADYLDGLKVGAKVIPLKQKA